MSLLTEQLIDKMLNIWHNDIDEEGVIDVADLEERCKNARDAASTQSFGGVVLGGHATVLHRSLLVVSEVNLPVT